jgi:hypothetical protein
MSNYNQLNYIKNVYYQNMALIKRNQELEIQNEKLREAVKILRSEIPKDKNTSKIQKKLNLTQEKVNHLEEIIANTKTQMEHQREHYLCKICFDNPREILYFPCLHLAVCKSCDNNLDECPICRQPIETQLSPYVL